MTTTLSKADVARLLSDPSLEARAEVAAKVAREVDGTALTAEERKIAEDIVRALSRDAAIRVRQALSEELKQSKHLPHDVALALGRDVEAVSLPVLSHSLVLTDADLIALVRSSGAAKQVAIAARRQVSTGVAEAIVEADEPVALATLVGNDGAELTEPLLQRVLDRHGSDETVQAPMAQRAHLPLTVLERLVAAASASLCWARASARRRRRCRPTRLPPRRSPWRSSCIAAAGSPRTSWCAPCAWAISLLSRPLSPCWRTSPSTMRGCSSMTPGRSASRRSTNAASCRPSCSS